jgi:ABC-type lipoprotein export system ATPase subunit
MSERRIYIALMGVTGSGKSSFVKTASGLDVGVGHELHSCEQDAVLCQGAMH